MAGTPPQKPGPSCGSARTCASAGVVMLGRGPAGRGKWGVGFTSGQAKCSAELGTARERMWVGVWVWSGQNHAAACSALRMHGEPFFHCKARRTAEVVGRDIQDIQIWKDPATRQGAVEPAGRGVQGGAAGRQTSRRPTQGCFRLSLLPVSGGCLQHTLGLADGGREAAPALLYRRCCPSARLLMLSVSFVTVEGRAQSGESVPASWLVSR